MSRAATPVRDETSHHLGLKVLVTTNNANVYEGYLEHFIPAEACVLINHHLKQDTQVRVDVNGFQFEGTVVFCKHKNTVYEAHIVIPDADETGRRRDPRYTVNLPARIYGSHTNGPIDGILVDISRDGLGLNCLEKLEVGDTLAVESQASLAFGTVRYCRQTHDGSYRAGLLVHSVIGKEQTPCASQAKRAWVRNLFAPS